MRQTAADRNPDEFSFKMLSSRTDAAGVRLGDRGNRALSMDVVKLLKTQDMNYIRTMRQQVRKERERLEAELLLVDHQRPRALGDMFTVAGGSAPDKERAADAQKKPQHTVFVENRTQQGAFCAEQWFSVDDKAGLEQAWNRPRRRQADSSKSAEAPSSARHAPAEPPSRKQHQAQLLAHQESDQREAELKEAREKRAQRLETVLTRERELKVAERELELQRDRMNAAVGGVNKNGKRYKMPRKR